MPTDIYNTVGTEQEMFIIDKKVFDKRPDLIATGFIFIAIPSSTLSLFPSSPSGRTLFGAPPPNGQESRTHYWGKMPPVVLNAFDGIQQRLLELGVPVATIHNEVAPCQFELGVISLPF